MKWYVYNFDINRQKIDKYNVFDHWGFVKYMKQYVKKYKKMDEFAEKLKSEVRYYFWSKVECELIIEINEDDRVFLIPFVGCKNPEGTKIDVTDDEMLDWRAFAEKHIKKQVYGNKAKIDIAAQLMFVWDEFLNYVWENKKEILKIET